MARIRESAHPVSPVVLERWSPRAFSDQPVETAKLQSLFEAARWAPSCFNDQPWHFMLATRDNPAEYERMLSCLVEKNQSWAKTAPVLLISVATLRFEQIQKPNRLAVHDLGIATGFLMQQAVHLGLVTHAMGGFSQDKARQVYDLPENSEPVAAIAIGYLGDPAILPEDFKKAEMTPSERKPISKFVFSGKWAHVAPLAK